MRTVRAGIGTLVALALAGVPLVVVKGGPGTDAKPGADRAPSPPSASASPSFAAPAQTFAVGVNQYIFTRVDRTLRTLVFYPATGGAGGATKFNATVAAGRFPLLLFSHGLRGSPESYQALT